MYIRVHYGTLWERTPESSKEKGGLDISLSNSQIFASSNYALSLGLGAKSYKTLDSGGAWSGNFTRSDLIPQKAGAEFLDEIQTKVLRVFLLAIHSHLYSFALRFLFLLIHATSYRFYCLVTTL
jgi:hypothetical protein